MPLPEFTGTLGLKRAAHLLRRATFGATKQQIDDFATLTPAQAISRLFSSALPTPVPPIDPKTGTEWVTNGRTDANSEDFELENYFFGWFISQMLSASVDPSLSLAYSAREKIVMFLHTHFTTIKTKVGESRALYFQNQLFRLFALDAATTAPEINFKELTVKVSVDNAMLRLLDGNLNVKGSPNENYARELLELYSIGRGIEGIAKPPTSEQGDYYVYKEVDVQKAALVLTGWDYDETFSNIDPDTNLPRGKVKGNRTNASSHDNDLKTFSDRFNGATIQADPLLLNGSNATEESALDEIRQLVDLVYSKEATAKNICWKVYRFYAYGPHTSEAIQAIDSTIITEMANTFANNGFKLLPVIQNLLMSQHFYDSSNNNVVDDNFGGIIKSPLDLVTGTLRILDVPVPNMLTQTQAFYEFTGKVLGAVKDLGMNFYDPYDVAGYEAYHQFPLYHRYWITPNSLANRYNFIRLVVNKMEEMPYHVNVYNYINDNFGYASGNVNTLITEIAKYFYPMQDNLDFTDDTESALTAKRLNYFKEVFLQGFEESYWNPNGAEAEEWITLLFNTMLQTPEYQLA